MPKFSIFKTKITITNLLDNRIQIPFDISIFKAVAENSVTINDHIMTTKIVETVEDLFVTYISFSKVYPGNKELESLKIYGGYDSDEEVAKQKCIELIKAQCDVDVDINDVVVIKK